jgi:hypothetical protein
MKKLLFALIAAAALAAVFFLLALSTPAQGQLIQRSLPCQVPGNTSKIICALPGPLSTGTSIRVIEIDRSAAGARSVPGLTQIATASGLGGSITIWRGAPAGAVSFTVNLPNAYNAVVWVQEDTFGAALDGAQMSASGAINQAPQPISAGNLTAASAADYILVGCEDNMGAGGLTAGAGYNAFQTSLSAAHASAFVPGGFEDRTAGATGSIPANGKLALAQYQWTCLGVAFAGGGAPPPPNPPTVTLGAIPLAGTVPLTATPAESSSGVTITSVQFTLDGAPLNAAVTAAPYTTNWNTTATSNGTHAIGATATNSAGQTGSSATVSVLVNNSANPPPMTIITPVTLPTATQGAAYTANLAQIDQLTGGVPPYTFALSSGSLPGNLTLSAAGIISGTPNVIGTFNFGYIITDSSGTAMVLQLQVVAERVRADDSARQ